MPAQLRSSKFSYPDIKEPYIAALVKTLKIANSYTRMEALLDLRGHVPNAEFWRLVGQEWDCCDNIFRYTDRLRFYFRRQFESGGFPIFEAMTLEDHRAYVALPERVAIFRGCYSHNKGGFSWTTNRDVAAGFPFRARYSGPTQPLLLSAIVRKANIAFMMADRAEAEIVVLPRHRRIVNCEPMSEPTDA